MSLRLIIIRINFSIDMKGNGFVYPSLVAICGKMGSLPIESLHDRVGFTLAPARWRIDVI